MTVWKEEDTDRESGSGSPEESGNVRGSGSPASHPGKHRIVRDKIRANPDQILGNMDSSLGLRTGSSDFRESPPKAWLVRLLKN